MTTVPLDPTSFSVSLMHIEPGQLAETANSILMQSTQLVREVRIFSSCTLDEDDEQALAFLTQGISKVSLSQLQETETFGVAFSEAIQDRCSEHISSLWAPYNYVGFFLTGTMFHDDFFVEASNVIAEVYDADIVALSPNIWDSGLNYTQNDYMRVLDGKVSFCDRVYAEAFFADPGFFDKQISSSFCMNKSKAIAAFDGPTASSMMKLIIQSRGLYIGHMNFCHLEMILGESPDYVMGMSDEVLIGVDLWSYGPVVFTHGAPEDGMEEKEFLNSLGFKDGVV